MVTRPPAEGIPTSLRDDLITYLFCTSSDRARLITQLSARNPGIADLLMDPMTTSEPSWRLTATSDLSERFRHPLTEVVDRLWVIQVGHVVDQVADVAIVEHTLARLGRKRSKTASNGSEAKPRRNLVQAWHNLEEGRYADESEHQRVTREHVDRIVDELLTLDAHNKQDHLEKSRTALTGALELGRLASRDARGINSPPWTGS